MTLKDGNAEFTGIGARSAAYSIRRSAFASPSGLPLIWAPPRSASNSRVRETAN